MLETNTHAPAITGESTRGLPITLSPTHGVYRHLQFHRFAGCPVCNLAVRAFVERYDELEAAGVETTMFFHSTVEELRAALEGVTLPFDIIADPEREKYARYGVERSAFGIFSPKFMAKAMRGMASGFISAPWGHTGGMTGLPADFLLDSHGVLRRVHYGAHAADSYTVDDVLAGARAINDPAA